MSKNKVDRDSVDAAIPNRMMQNKKVPSIECLSSEMPDRELRKDRGRKMLKTLLNRLRLKKCASASISKPDPNYRVAYLGNVVTGWAKGDGCVEKPLATLWRNYTHSSRPDVRMQLTVSSGGLKATTRDHGLTEYWAHRLTTCAAPSQFPRLFCWVYRHEGRRLRHELRCHAVLCPTAAVAKQIEAQLKHALQLALHEFKRDKISKQNARLSLVNSVYENPTIPRRKILLSTGSQNYRPPLERSKSAPKLTAIEEIIEEEEDPFEFRRKNSVYKKILRHYDSTTALLDKRKLYMTKFNSAFHSTNTIVPVKEQICDEQQYSNDDSTVNYNEEINDLTIDEKSERILKELVENSLRNDLLEHCERAWYTALGETPDLIPPDSDEGSLSSGCESASTVTSEIEAPTFPTIEESTEEQEENILPEKNKKTDNVDFKVGGSVLAHVRNFEHMNSLKYCALNNHIYNNNKNFIANEEVSLVPVGESHSDFSSLKVFKRRSFSELPRDNSNAFEDEHDGAGSEEENGSACSDESGYEEEEVATSVANVVLV